MQKYTEFQTSKLASCGGIKALESKSTQKKNKLEDKENAIKSLETETIL